MWNIGLWFESSVMILFTLSILVVLDRYGIGTVPLHLSTLVNVSLILSQYFVVLVQEQTVPVEFGPFSLYCGQVDRYSFGTGMDVYCSAPKQTVPEQFVPI